MTKRFRVTKGNDNSVAMIDLFEEKQLVFIKFNNSDDAESMFVCLNYHADFMNHLVEENEQLKQTIHEAYTNERTHIGRSVLKQLLESLE